MTGRVPIKTSIGAGPICGEVETINLLDTTVTMAEPEEQGIQTADPLAQIQRSRSI